MGTTVARTESPHGESQVNAQWVRLGGAALILSTVLACASDPATGPGSAARLKRMRMNDAPDTVTVVSRGTPLAQQISASQVIGPEGGTLELPATGLKVTVPRNAV